MNTDGLNWHARLIKRIIDLIGALLGILISIPILLIAGLIIKLTSPGSVFYSQERAGKNGKAFRIIKLRTMVAGAEEQLSELLYKNILRGHAYKIPNDPRVTAVGRFLRRWSLDELPQFWNVLMGEMSLVGPRPEEVWVVAQYSQVEWQRLSVKPGITGPMQVNGRGNLDMDIRLKLELDYIQHYSLWKDIIILTRSIPTILSGRGSY